MSAGQVCVGCKLLPGGRHPRWMGGPCGPRHGDRAGDTPKGPLTWRTEAEGTETGQSGCGRETWAVSREGLTDGRAAQRSERWDVWKSSWGHEPRDPRPIRRKQERGPRVRQGNAEQNQTQGAGAPRTITKGSPARLCGPGTVRSERGRQQGRGGAERWPRVLRRGSASSHSVL